MARASDDLFRAVALDRMASPEQLDRLITLAPPAGWAALAALVALIVTVVLWGLFGSVPTRVVGAGILIERGGQVFDAMAPAPGVLATVAPIGTVVRRGDVVATLDDTQAQQDLRHAEALLEEQQDQLAQLTRRLDGEIEASRRVDAQKRENLEAIAAAALRRKAFYEQSLHNESPVAERGYLTRRFMQDTRQQIELADQEVRQARNQLLSLAAEDLDRVGRRDQEVWRQQEAVNAARRAVEELTIGMRRSTRIVSPIAGHVTEVKASPGVVLAPGKPIVSIEASGEGLELVLYVPPDQGKKISPGMEVRIEPATVKKEEFGTLLGRVVEVSPFPVSPEGITARLQNPQLVARFSAQGAPYEARVTLIGDPGTASGYAWSAGRGPAVQLSSGTTATAEITVRRQAPISLVLPLLRDRTGIGG